MKRMKRIKLRPTPGVEFNCPEQQIDWRIETPEEPVEPIEEVEPLPELPTSIIRASPAQLHANMLQRRLEKHHEVRKKLQRGIERCISGKADFFIFQGTLEKGDLFSDPNFKARRLVRLHRYKAFVYNKSSQWLAGKHFLNKSFQKKTGNKIR